MHLLSRDPRARIRHVAPLLRGVPHHHLRLQRQRCRLERHVDHGAPLDRYFQRLVADRAEQQRAGASRQVETVLALVVGEGAVGGAGHEDAGRWHRRCVAGARHPAPHAVGCLRRADRRRDQRQEKQRTCGQGSRAKSRRTGHTPLRMVREDGPAWRSDATEIGKSHADASRVARRTEACEVLPGGSACTPFSTADRPAGW